MSSEQKSVEYETKDIRFAAFLWCVPGVVLQENGVRRSGNTVYWKFTIPGDAENLKSLTVKYYNKQMTVEPLTFCEKTEYLRNLMFSAMGIEFRRQ
jgi:hypothetical protein